MNESLIETVKRLENLSNEDLANCVMENDDVQWCLSELRDVLGVIGDMSVSRLRELIQADREGRCTISPSHRKWREKHHKCAWCIHCVCKVEYSAMCESEITCMCNAKRKRVDPTLPRPFCRLFQMSKED